MMTKPKCPNCQRDWCGHLCYGIVDCISYARCCWCGAQWPLLNRVMPEADWRCTPHVAFASETAEEDEERLAACLDGAGHSQAPPTATNGSESECECS